MVKQREWIPVVDKMSNVEKLVHLAMRRDSVDVEEIRRELTRVRQRVYNEELAIQARRAGCGGAAGRLESGPSLTALSEDSKKDAESIINTYNFDLAMSIREIRRQVPAANRHVYAYRLSQWNARRNQWKAPQVAQHTETSARSRAQKDFYKFNNLEGFATLQPETAVCPICQGWINRGKVPMRVAQNNPPPYHVECVHGWSTFPERIARGDCKELWMGEG